MPTAAPVRANEYETLDALAWRHLGTTRGVVEATLENNPGLAALGPRLPIGHAVQLAQPERAATRPTINLWD